jgi:hypothetical protein
LQEENYLELHENMIERGVGPFQLETHIPAKRVYQRYETWNTYMESPKPNSLKR